MASRHLRWCSLRSLHGVRPRRGRASRRRIGRGSTLRARTSRRSVGRGCAVRRRVRFRLRARCRPGGELHRREVHVAAQPLRLDDAHHPVGVRRAHGVGDGGLQVRVAIEHTDAIATRLLHERDNARVDVRPVRIVLADDRVGGNVLHLSRAAKPRTPLSGWRWR